jgi:hypothetical protein
MMNKRRQEGAVTAGEPLRKRVCGDADGSKLTLLKLPENTLELIAFFTPTIVDFCTLSSVCHLLHDICESESMWRYLFFSAIKGQAGPVHTPKTKQRKKRERNCFLTDLAEKSVFSRFRS